jgi:hypothetical protein
MPNPIENYAFENFPRQPLPENISRRELFGAFLTMVKVESQRSHGKKVLILSELGEWPDERLAPLVPVMARNSTILMKDGFVIGKPPRSDRSDKLFPLDSPALTAFKLINGLNTLEQISQRLAEQTGWEHSHSFAYVRGLFLVLVEAGLSHPKDA